MRLNALPCCAIVAFITFTVWGQAASPPAGTGAAPASAADKYTHEELELIVGPIALYPDVLLSQMFVASAYPNELAQAASWVQSNPNYAGIEQQPWSASVKAVARIPDALQMLTKDPDWTASLAYAVGVQTKEVMATVQELRTLAKNSGALQSGSQQTVRNEQSTITITPTDPEVIYVPQYEPEKVYVESRGDSGTTVVESGGSTVVYDDDDGPYTGAVATGLLSFGAGMVAGNWLSDGYWNHHGHAPYYPSGYPVPPGGYGARPTPYTNRSGNTAIRGGDKVKVGGVGGVGNIGGVGGPGRLGGVGGVGDPGRPGGVGGAGGPGRVGGVGDAGRPGGVGGVGGPGRVGGAGDPGKPGGVGGVGGRGGIGDAGRPGGVGGPGGPGGVGRPGGAGGVGGPGGVGRPGGPGGVGGTGRPGAKPPVATPRSTAQRSGVSNATRGRPPTGSSAFNPGSRSATASASSRGAASRQSPTRSSRSTAQSGRSMSSSRSSRASSGFSSSSSRSATRSYSSRGSSSRGGGSRGGGGRGGGGRRR